MPPNNPPSPPQPPAVPPSTGAPPIPPTTTPPTPAPAPAETPPPQDNEDDLLADQEEDLFWVVQKILWEIIKIVLIIAVLGFVIWAIWIPGKNSDTPVLPKKLFQKTEAPQPLPQPKAAKDEVSFWKKLFSEDETDKVKKEPADKSPSVPPPTTTPPPKTPKSTLPPAQASTILSSTHWLQKAYTFLNASAAELLPSSAPNIRRKTIDRLISDVERLIDTAESIQQQLHAEYQAFSDRSKEANQHSVLNEKAFFEALNRFDGPSAEIFLSQKADAEQLVMTNSAFANGRKVLLQNIAHYDKRLRGLYENLVANKEALIYDVKVVNFPKSTLEIILSPQEWRSGQR